MVEFFNANGLKTYMSCEGHNKTNMSMYWIEFDNCVTEQDILKFMNSHLSDWCNGKVFISYGRFAERLIPGPYSNYKVWAYFAATVEAAMEDLNRWKKLSE